jgi:transposase-like protein
VDLPLSSRRASRAAPLDFLLSENRDKAAAQRFFKKAIGNNGEPEKITLDGYEASHAAVSELQAEGVLSSDVEARTSKYLPKSTDKNQKLSLASFSIALTQTSLYLYSSEAFCRQWQKKSKSHWRPLDCGPFGSILNWRCTQSALRL